MYYVLFFNMFFVLVFSKLLWNQGIIVYKELFWGRSFITMYVAAFILLIVFLLKKSPADVIQEKQKREVEAAQAQRQNLEFMVASRKLKQDMIAQANIVKDELQLIEGAWRSKVHDIVNELPPVKEQQLHQEVILPFQKNIIRHLRDLERSLTFDLEPVTLDELFVLITEFLEKRAMSQEIKIDERGWKNSMVRVFVDRNKICDMLLNVLRNSQTALDLKRIEMLKKADSVGFKPVISMSFMLEDTNALLTVTDNAGGVSAEYSEKLYKEPVMSKKSGGKRMGQGAMFVKFFSERMGLNVTVRNSELCGDKGLSVSLRLPFYSNTGNQQKEQKE